MNAVTKIYRYEVPVDDQWHAHEVSGPILHVSGRTAHTVEFWAVHQDGATRRGEFRAFGTGQPLPDDVQYVGTVVHPGLVWHLFGREGAR